MTRTRDISEIVLVLAFLLQFVISVEAFDLHTTLGRRSLKSPWKANSVTDDSEGVIKLQGHRNRLDEYDEYSGRRMGTSTTRQNTGATIGTEQQWSSRNQFFNQCRAHLAVGLAVSAASSVPSPSNARSYSENAANLERINNGDYSGGAVFNNSPTTERGKKRRAMTGCKVALSREEASSAILKRKTMLSEKECNSMVMDGETEFMLQALRNLDCPTCANGIGKAE
jgi:hypothetical protein